MRAYRHGKAVAISIAILSVATPVFAGGGDSGAPYVDGMLRKLGRGIANIATCPAEIPRTASLVGRNDGIFAEITTGVFQGVWRGVLRAVTGVFEVGTFFVEIPKGFGPLMRPEYVWAHGSWAE